MAMKNRTIQGLFYITHIDNLPSILQHGILSHNEIERRNIDKVPIYNPEVVERRRNIITPAGDTLLNYVNLYFQPRNPMMYAVIDRFRRSNIVVLKIRRNILNRHDIFISDGNAAHSSSTIYPARDDILNQIAKSIDIEYWKEYDGSKRRIMAECLVPEPVTPDQIECIYLPVNGANRQTALDAVRQSNWKIDVVPEPYMFFQPSQYNLLPGTQITLVRGDMFFSQMHTLTISVNTQGIMGKGLASRAKYQFPDIYVQYQDLCRSRQIAIGKPAFLKREHSLTSELVEIDLNKGEMGFLLFPTKAKWREDSKIEYIVDGMKYLLSHYQTWGIPSLALPALGCGLGNLEWKDVGPIICSDAHRMGIPVSVYLPAEHEIDPQHLTRSHLIRA